MKKFINGICVEISGCGAPLFLLHGNGETHHIFEEAAPLLAPHFTLIMPDTRGHGESAPVREYHYADMADDLLMLIRALELPRAAVYGFSDGGITALLAAIASPERISRVIASGANTVPEGLTDDFLQEIGTQYEKTDDPLLRLILEEPHIDEAALAGISVPVHLIAGERDIVKPEHSEWLARTIGCPLKVLKGETHESYVIHSTMVAHKILQIMGVSDR